MDAIKLNFAELAKAWGCDYRTAKKYFYHDKSKPPIRKKCLPKRYQGKYTLHRHKEMKSAIFKCENMLLNNILDSIQKRAVGYETEEVTTYEIVGDKKKQRIVKTKKVYPPDIDACKYLLMIKFGREYYHRKSELEILKKKTT